MKRHTRIFKICSGRSRGKDRLATSHLEVGTNDGNRCDQFLQDWQRWLDNGNATFWACLEDMLVAELGESVNYRPAAARADASGMQPTTNARWYHGHHARTGSILILTTDDIIKAAGHRRMSVEKQKIESWCALRGLPSYVTERRTNAAEPIQAPRSQVVHLPSAPRPSCVTRADLGKHGVTIGCAACSLTLLFMHGKTTKPHTDECRARIGEQVEHDFGGSRAFASPQTQARCET